MNRYRGFTLLEIMVALVIFASVALALLKSVNDSARLTGELSRRQWADLVAHNAMVDLTLAGRSSGKGTTEMAGQRFRWQIDAYPTAADDIQRLELSIFTEGESVALSRLSAFQETASGPASP